MKQEHFGGIYIYTWIQTERLVKEPVLKCWVVQRIKGDTQKTKLTEIGCPCNYIYIYKNNLPSVYKYRT